MLEHVEMLLPGTTRGTVEGTNVSCFAVLGVPGVLGAVLVIPEVAEALERLDNALVRLVLALRLPLLVLGGGGGTVLIMLEDEVVGVMVGERGGALT